MIHNITLSNSYKNKINFKRKLTPQQSIQDGESKANHKLRNGLITVGISTAAIISFLIARGIHKSFNGIGINKFLKSSENGIEENGIEKVITEGLRKPLSGGLTDTKQLKTTNQSIFRLAAKIVDFARGGELIIHDRHDQGDKFLITNLKEFEGKFQRLICKDAEDQENIARLVYDHICDTFPHAPQELLTVREDNLKNKAIHLDEFIKHKSGVCRHRAALGVNMGEIMNDKNKNIEITSYSDSNPNPNLRQNHSWNYLWFNRNGPKSEQQIFKIDTIYQQITKYKKGYIPDELKKK